MNRFLRAFIAVVVFLGAASASAATNYVTDELRISVRTGAGNQYRIVEVIPTGTRIETLQVQGEWTEIRLDDGKTGWVRSQYLTDRPVAADRLERTRKELSTAQEQISELEKALEKARSELTEARSRIETLSSTKQQLEQKLSQAEKGLALHDDNERLRKSVAQLKQKVGELERQNARIADRAEQEWFMIGGGVVLASILFGIIVTRIPWRRRSDRMF